MAPSDSTAAKYSRADLTSALKAGCGNTIAVCAAEDTGRFSSPAANETCYESCQTYHLPVVFGATTSTVEDVAAKAPEAGYLLVAAFPHLSLAQAGEILTSTEGTGGRFLDDGSASGVYSRLNLYAVAKKAAAFAASR